MRILLDECVPQPLRHEFPGHDVFTVGFMGWAGKKNGELLQLMLPEKFDVFVTIDKNLIYQQNLRAAQVAVLLLNAPPNKLQDLLPLMPAAQTALATIRAGDFVEIS